CGDTPGLSRHGPTSTGVTTPLRFTFRPSADSCRGADGGRMKIAVLGSGPSARRSDGSGIPPGTRRRSRGEMKQPRDLAAELGARARAHAATVADAAAGAGAVLMAVPGPAV